MLYTQHYTLYKTNYTLYTQTFLEKKYWPKTDS